MAAAGERAHVFERAEGPGGGAALETRPVGRRRAMRPSREGALQHHARTRAGQPHQRLRRFVHGAAPGGATAPILGARGRMTVGRQREGWEPVRREL